MHSPTRCRGASSPRRRCARPLRGGRDDRSRGMRSSRHRRDSTEPGVGVSQNRASTRSSFRGRAGRGRVAHDAGVAGDAGRLRNWRKPGKLRPPYDVGVFPHMTAKQGAQRGQSEACPPLLPRNCRSSATSAPRTSRSTRWRDALVATRRALAFAAIGPLAASKRGRGSVLRRSVASTRGFGRSRAVRSMSDGMQRPTTRRASQMANSRARAGAGPGPALVLARVPCRAQRECDEASCAASGECR